MDGLHKRPSECSLLVYSQTMQLYYNLIFYNWNVVTFAENQYNIYLSKLKVHSGTYFIVYKFSILFLLSSFQLLLTMSPNTIGSSKMLVEEIFPSPPWKNLSDPFAFPCEGIIFLLTLYLYKKLTFIFIIFMITSVSIIINSHPIRVFDGWGCFRGS